MDERDKVGERAPAPRHGWNVMQVGQVGWHVVQAVEGWTVTPLFGPEILSREGAPLAVAASPVANLEGGQGVADAPAEAAESALARLRADQDAMVGAVIEEAAGVAGRFYKKALERADADPDDDEKQGFACACGSIEAAIRALAAHAQPQKGERDE